jgi:L-lactate dehydrogenase (cytochrome)
MIRDRGFLRDLLAQAKEARCSTLVFTVDMPVPGSRYRDIHSGLAGAPGLMGDLRRYWQAVKHPRWAWDVGLFGRPHQLGNVAPVLGKNSGLEDFLAWMRNNFDPTVSWRDLDFIRESWDGPLIIKGILDADDARAAADVGADGIVVSNHGGRQLDGVPSTARALPPLPRPWGTADRAGRWRRAFGAGCGAHAGAGGQGRAAGPGVGLCAGRWRQAGVSHMLRLIEAEMRVAMALTGCTKIRTSRPMRW